MLLLIVSLGCQNENTDSAGKIIISEVMGGSDSIYSKADKVRKFVFPEDHAAHNDYKIEWWYFTGNLKTSNGRLFGYQFTIFRNALKDKLPDINSTFSTNQLFFYHLTLSDIENNKFYYYENYARGAAGIAGTNVNPLKIWVNQSSITGIADPNEPSKVEFNIKAIADDFTIDFNLIPQKNIVLHGNQGLSYKSKDTSNASYYYSFTRLQTEGNIFFKRKNYNVNGFSWFDREWSTSALSSEQTGWDWFSIQLDNNAELMYFKLRNKSGEIDFAKGTLINSDGSYQNLKQDDVQIEIQDYWQNDEGIEYPSKWKIKIPERNIDLNIQTRIPNQELKLAIRYYEGSIKVDGMYDKQKINGSGYVEMTGYNNQKK